jgi:hypothetical protein
MNGGARPRVPFLGLCLAEWRKIRGRGLAAAVLLFGALHGLFGAGALWAFEFLGKKAGATEVDVFETLSAAELSLRLAVFPVNGFALLLLASIVWAEDWSLGTMGAMLVRPVARWKVFLSKLAVLWLVASGSVLLAGLLGALFGLPLLGLEGDLEKIGGAPFLGWMTDVPELRLRLARVLLAVPAAALLFLPAISLASLLGSITRSPVATLFLSVFALLLDFLAFLLLKAWGGTQFDGHERAARLAQWTLWGCRELLDLRVRGTLWTEGWDQLAVCGGASAAMLLLALWIFSRRDVS